MFELRRFPGLWLLLGYDQPLVQLPPNICSALSRNLSGTLGGNHAAHSEEIRISPQISGSANNSPTGFSLSVLNCNSHLDFSQFSFGFLGTKALQFPLQFFSLAQRTQKALAHERMACRSNPIERGRLRRRQIEKISIYFPPSSWFLLLEMGNSGLNVRPAGWVGGLSK